MKKYIAFFTFILWVTCTIQAQPVFTPKEREQFNAALRRAVAEKEKIQATVTVEIPITKQYFTNPRYTQIDFENSNAYRTLRNVRTYQSTVGCKAYALDDHWLIAGAACLWNGRHQVTIHGDIYYTGLVEENIFKNYLKIDDTKWVMKDHLFIQPHDTQLPHFVLIRVPQKSELAKTVKAMPKINILSLTQTNPLNLKKGVFYVNTSRFGLNTAKLRMLKSFNHTQHTVTIKESLDDLATLSNDPLLYSVDDNIYWIGINNGIMFTNPIIWSAQPSTRFVTFNNADIDFIEQVITRQDPDAWPRIAPRLHKDRVK